MINPLDVLKDEVMTLPEERFLADQSPDKTNDATTQPPEIDPSIEIEQPEQVEQPIIAHLLPDPQKPDTGIFLDDSFSSTSRFDVQLSRWDEFCGPEVTQVWHCHSKVDSVIIEPEERNEVENYIGRQTLLVESNSMTTNCSILSAQFFAIPEFDATVSSIVFCVEPEYGCFASRETLRELPRINTRFSLSVVNSYDELDRIIHINEMLQHYIGQMTMCFRSFLRTRKDPSTRPDWTVLNPVIRDFIEGFNIVHQATLTQPVTFSRSWYTTELSPEKLGGLARILTSFLQTQGRAVVIGPSLTEVNIYIRTLSLFLPFEHQITLSRQPVRIFSPQDLITSYCPHVWLQGFSCKRYDKNELKNAILELKSEFLMSPGPTTLIDLYRIPATADGKPRLPTTEQLDKFKVVVPTLFPHRYQELSRQYVEGRTKNLRLKPNANIPFTSQLPVRKVPDSAILVEEMLTVLFGLPLCMRKHYLQTSVEGFLLRSSSLLSYLKNSLGKLIEFADRTSHFRTSEEFVESAQGRIPWEVLYPQSMLQFEKRLTEELLIGSAEDLYCLLSVAERIRPNLYVSMFGNPIIDSEVAEILRYFCF